MEKDFQRWTAKRKVELLLQLIRGQTKLVDACREHDLKQSEVEGWMETFLQSGERGLKARSEDEQAVHERELRELRRRSASSCWSSTREKSWTPSPENPRKPSDGAGFDARRRERGVDRAAVPLVQRTALDILLPTGARDGPAARHR